jgi:hypothetical protein
MGTGEPACSAVMSQSDPTAVLAEMKRTEALLRDARSEVGLVLASGRGRTTLTRGGVHACANARAHVELAGSPARESSGKAGLLSGQQPCRGEQQCRGQT